jgi:transposase
MDMRELKGLEIAARSKLTYKQGAWYVPSQGNRGAYRVTLSPESCECEDFVTRARACKHVIAARLVQERDHGGKAPPIDFDAVPTRPTYKQDWPKYNLAQTTEKKRFLELLFDLCRGVTGPERKPVGGQKPHAYRDCIFAMTYKVFCGFSSRRLSCDLTDAHARGYLTRHIPGMKVCSFFESPVLTPILQNLIRKSALPLRAVESTFAPDSTGFSVSRHVRWHDEKYGQVRSGKDWVKAHAICGVTTNVVTAVEIAGRDANDSPMFRPLVGATAENFKVERVCADKAYLSRENLDLVDSLGATAYVPFKSNSGPGEVGSVWERMFHYYNFRREEFLRHYHQRSNAESTFSMVKAKFRDHVLSKTDTAMKNEVLCKFLCHNICVVHQSHIELGIEPVFWGDKPPDSSGPTILPLVRPG